MRRKFNSICVRFPQTPRKEDLLMESGEYFVAEEERKRRRLQEKQAIGAQKAEEKKRKREAEFKEPPKPNKKVKSQKAVSDN